MSRVTAPLLSFGASGQIAKTQVYSTWKGRPYVRRYSIPSNPQTSEQTETRSLFSWLNNVWKYMPASAVAAWQAYGQNSRFTDRNGFIKVNLGPMRGDSDTANFIFSPAANGGMAAQAMVATGGNDQVTVDLTAPSLPAGWTIVEAIAAAIREQDPQSGTLFEVTAGTDATSTYQIILTGLASAQTYRVGGWFKYLKPDGSNAYGQALMDDALTT